MKYYGSGTMRPGSGHGYGSDENASADEGVAGNSDEEEDLWPMSRPHVMSSTGAAPALPESLATNQSMLPGGISVDKWREQRSITSYRMPFGGRKKKYRLNREYFRRLINTKKIAARGASPSNQQVDKALKARLAAIGRQSRRRAMLLLMLVKMKTKTCDEHTNRYEWQPRGSRVVKMIRQIYEDKLSAETNAFRNGYRAPTMVEYLSEWASTRYGMPALVEQMCWDLYHRCSCTVVFFEIDTFARFVDEDASSESYHFSLH